MFMHTSIHVYITVTIKEFYIKVNAGRERGGGGECSNSYKYSFCHLSQ